MSPPHTCAGSARGGAEAIPGEGREHHLAERPGRVSEMAADMTAIGGVLGAFAYQFVSDHDTVADAAVMGVPSSGPEDLPG